MQVKPIVLLVAHMYGLFEKDELKVGSLEKNLEEMLRAIPNLMEILLEQTLMLNQMFRAGRSLKRITAKNVLTLI